MEHLLDLLSGVSQQIIPERFGYTVTNITNCEIMRRFLQPLQTPPHYFTIRNNEKCLVRTESNNKDEKSIQEPNIIIQIVILVIQISLDSFQVGL